MPQLISHPIIYVAACQVFFHGNYQEFGGVWWCGGVAAFFRFGQGVPRGTGWAGIVGGFPKSAFLFSVVNIFAVCPVFQNRLFRREYIRDP
jgi:hypothetical protein